MATGKSLARHIVGTFCEFGEALAARTTVCAAVLVTREEGIPGKVKCCAPQSHADGFAPTPCSGKHARQTAAAGQNRAGGWTVGALCNSAIPASRSGSLAAVSVVSGAGSGLARQQRNEGLLDVDKHLRAFASTTEIAVGTNHVRRQMGSTKMHNQPNPVAPWAEWGPGLWWCLTRTGSLSQTANARMVLGSIARLRAMAVVVVGATSRGPGQPGSAAQADANDASSNGGWATASNACFWPWSGARWQKKSVAGAVSLFLERDR